jgi:hypothetical protein
MNIPHQQHLAILLQRILLINADGINPANEGKTAIARLFQTLRWNR